MNRILVSAVLLAAATSATAAEQTRSGYLVATRGKVRAERILSTEADPQNLLGVQHFTVVDGFAANLTATEVEAIKDHPDVLFVEKNVERELFDDPAAFNQSSEQLVTGASLPALLPVGAQVVPYGINLVKAPKVWPLSTGVGIRIGVIDTGIQRTHVDLVDRYRSGRDLAYNDNDPEDAIGHGTHVAGTIAATDNDFGVVGVAPGADIYAIRVFNNSGRITKASALIDAVDYAIANDLHILNLSLGGKESSILEEQAFEKAFREGILVFASSGNDGFEVINYPAGYGSVVGVGAVSSDTVVASFSTRGPNVKIVGPGVGVLSTVPAGKSDLSYLDVTNKGKIESRLMTSSPRGSLKGEYVYCDLGRVGDFPSSVTGKIALIKRGDLTFAEKAKNAKAAGATGVIIFNREPGIFTGTLGTEPFAFPLTLSVSQEDGEALLALKGSSVELFFEDYDEYNGTSMSCPHVVGVAALIWAMAPNAKPAEVRDALITTTTDLGPAGWDTAYGYGLVDAYEAAKKLAPEKFITVPPRRRGVRQ